MQKYITFTLTFFILFLAFILDATAQVGGNQLYQTRNSNVRYNRNPVETESIRSEDNTLVITSKVLLNQKAKHYLITVGANQIGKTVFESNQKLNNRIDNVIKKLKNLNISKDDIYVDFIAETKLYDHTITGKEVQEYFDGFSIRKNIIIKVKELENIDKIINYCAQEEIYDIIKVDYISQDLETINNQLLEEALKITEKKKKIFEENSSVTLSYDYRLTSEQFRIYYPKNLYKQYNEASETSTIESRYNSSYIKKEVRKETTFYYDGMETELGIDKIIDEISPIVGIQYVLEIQVTYELKR
ncbi:SIMPL domain-containing protein [Bernardetia sp. ABR2-2B]|uniref:SIMPL domain-containing protein n=1 Tax=Bernardetia sp. ABR2-2B TaxID=3127472 RepID=UPI0030CB3C7B